MDIGIVILKRGFMRNELFKNLIVYEIYPTSFFFFFYDGIGDLNGITQKLDYVKDTGFNAIWLNPFYLSPFNDGGYDVKDFKAVDPRFGTKEDFINLLKEAHKRDIKIIIDLVAGHTSEEHPYFLKSGEEERNEYSDLFIWTNDVWNLNPKYKLISGRHPRNGNYLVNFFSFQPALNFGFKDIDDPSWQMHYTDTRTYKAREFIIDVMLYWLDLGVDGFRVDMADSLVKNDDNKEATIEVWNYMFSKVKEKYPNSFFVSEWCNPWQSFKAGFDADFILDHWDNFYHDFVRADQYSNGPSVLDGADEAHFIEDLMARYNASLTDGGYLAHISGNHDVIRLANYNIEEKIRIYFMLMFFLPGIPFVYYGDEIGMKHIKMKNKDGGYQRVGSRTPMQWNHDINDGFSKTNKELYLPVNQASDITLEDNLNNENSLYYFIKKLADIRRNNEFLQGKEMVLDNNSRLITISRGDLVLTMNLTNEEINIKGNVLLSTGEGNILKPYQAAISKKD